MALHPDVLDKAAVKASSDLSPGSGFVTGDLLAEVLLDFQDQLMQAIVLPLRRRVEVLEKQLAALESRPTVKYHGAFKEGRIYDEGALCSHDGSVWHCNQRTGSPPGNGLVSWTLAVKRGRDGKDAS